MPAILVRATVVLFVALAMLLDTGPVAAQAKRQWIGIVERLAGPVPQETSPCRECGLETAWLNSARRDLHLYTFGRQHFTMQLTRAKARLAKLREEFDLIDGVRKSGMPVSYDASMKLVDLRYQISAERHNVDTYTAYLDEITNDLQSVEYNVKNAELWFDRCKSKCNKPTVQDASKRMAAMVGVSVGGVIGSGDQSPVDILGGAEKIHPGGGSIFGAEGKVKLPDPPFIIGFGLFYSPLSTGPSGIFGSRQDGRLIDGRLGVDVDVLRMVGAPGDRFGYAQLSTGALSISAGGGVALINYNQTSTSAAGGRHDSTFTGAGPYLHADITLPLLSSGLPGDAVFYTYAGVSGGPLFGGLGESSSFGVAGSHSRVVWNVNGQAGLGFMLPNGVSIGGEVFVRHYSSIADGTLNSSATINDINRTLYGVMARVSYAFWF